MNTLKIFNECGLFIFVTTIKLQKDYNYTYIVSFINLLKIKGKS